MFKVGDKVETNRGGICDDAFVEGVICSIEGNNVYIAQNERKGSRPNRQGGLDFMYNNGFNYSWQVYLDDDFGYIKLKETVVQDWFKKNICLK